MKARTVSLRPHLSTVFVGLLVGGHCVLSNLVDSQRLMWVDHSVPGGRLVEGDSHLEGVPTNTYGWPWRWVDFSAEASGPTFDPRYCRWRGAPLAADVAVCLVMTLGAIIVCEALARRWRLRFRFSLRTLLLATGLLGLGLGWWVIAARRVAREDEIARTLLADAPFAPYPYLECDGPRWLSLFGIQRPFARLIGVDTYLGDLDDETLTALSALQYLDHVYYWPDEEGLVGLTRLAHVRNLRLEVANWSPSHNEILAALPSLEGVRFEVLEYAEGFENWGIAGVPHLREFAVSVDQDAPSADFRLDSMVGFRSKRGLIDLAWARWLAQQPNLRAIDAAIEVSAIEALAECPRLEIIVVSEDSFDSPEDFQTLVRKLPHVKVLSDEKYPVDGVQRFWIGERPRTDWEYWEELTERQGRWGVWNWDSQALR